MIFVSYSWEDRPAAELLTRLFDEQGIPYWVDSEQLDLNRPLEPQILAGLLRASAVAYLDTAASRSSYWVEFELLHARYHSIPLIVLTSPPSSEDDGVFTRGVFTSGLGIRYRVR